MTKSGIKILLLILILQGYLFSQSTGDAVILMQGKVLDRNGRPVGTSIQFENLNGKKINTKSNATDGLYQLVITPGVKYSVNFKDYVEVSGDVFIDLPLVKEYTELSRSFTVSKIEEGMELLKTSVFNSNESTLIGPYELYFKNLKSFLNTNMNISVNMTVHMHDCVFKDKKLKETYLDAKNKKRTRKLNIPAQQQAEELAQKRVSAIKEYLISNKIPERRININIDTKMDVPKPKPATKKSKTKKKVQEEIHTVSYPNIVIYVGKIMKL